MKTRDIVIGIIVLLLIGGVVLWRQRAARQEQPEPVGETLSREEQLEERFQLDIPEDVDKAELDDATGGTATGLATRKFEDGTFTHGVLADLPDPETGKFYQGWLVKGEEGDDDFDIVSTGRLSMAKGGWSLDFQASTDYSDYSRVLITAEEREDSTPEDTLLEGSF